MLAYVGAGSNLGDRRARLRAGLEGIGRRGVRILQVSSVWETEPVDSPEPLWFLNLVARVEASGGPADLLAVLQAVEKEAGRVPGPKNAPRELDLDLLLAGDLVVNEPGLVVPHPRMWQRSFVLAPLRELAPDLRDPISGRSVAEILASLARPSFVRAVGTLATAGTDPL